MDLFFTKTRVLVTENVDLHVSETTIRAPQQFWCIATYAHETTGFLGQERCPNLPHESDRRTSCCGSWEKVSTCPRSRGLPISTRFREELLLWPGKDGKKSR
jgi:hypothetical protein